MEGIGPIGAAIVVGLFFPLMVALYGILLAPIAAIFSALLAFRRGLSPWYFGFIGGVYFLFYALPFIYLTMRILGRRLPKGVLYTGYIIHILLFTLSYFAVPDLFVRSASGLSLVLAITIAIIVLGRLLPSEHSLYGRIIGNDDNPKVEYVHTPRHIVYTAPFMVTFLTVFLNRFF